MAETLKQGKDFIVLPYAPINQDYPTVEGYKFVIPPYDLQDITFTSRSALTIKQRFPDVAVGIVLPGTKPGDRDYVLGLLNRERFEPIIFHQSTMPPINRSIGFLSQAGLLLDDKWYHAAGVEDVIGPGYWTVSTDLKGS